MRHEIKSGRVVCLLFIILLYKTPKNEPVKRMRTPHVPPQLSLWAAGALTNVMIVRSESSNSSPTKAIEMPLSTRSARVT